MGGSDCKGGHQSAAAIVRWCVCVCARACTWPDARPRLRNAAASRVSAPPYKARGDGPGSHRATPKASS